MLTANDVSVLHIMDVLSVRTEKETQRLIHTFASPLNPDIEDFIWNKSIDFIKRKLSVTYFVLDNSDASLLGYFTVTHKALDVDADGLSGSKKKRLDRFGKYDPNKNSYNVSSFLLAQFGKNYNIDGGRRINGKLLMDCAMGTLVKIQYLVGGGVVYLDCEDKQKLISFYESEEIGFFRFGERVSEIDGKKYLQYLRFF